MTLVAEAVGDIFDSPTSSVLIHACNTKGSWGKGVAAAFKKYSPSAFQYYKGHCTNTSSPTTSLASHQKSLVGTCLLIPPFPGIEIPNGTTKPLPNPTAAQQEKQFCIACLFTSNGYGKNTDTSSAILKATESAIADLARQLLAHTEAQRLHQHELHNLEDQLSKAIRGSDASDDDAKVRGAPKKASESANADIRALKLNVEGKKRRSLSDMGGVYSVRINSGLFGVPWRDTKRVLMRGGVNMTVVRPPGEGIDDESHSGVMSEHAGAPLVPGKKELVRLDEERGKTVKEDAVGGLEVEGQRDDVMGEEGARGADGRDAAVKRSTADRKSDAHEGKSSFKDRPRGKDAEIRQVANGNKTGKKGVKRKMAGGSREESVQERGRGGRQTRLKFGKGE